MQGQAPEPLREGGNCLEECWSGEHGGEPSLQLPLDNSPMLHPGFPPLLPGKSPGMGSSCSLPRRCLSSEGLSPEPPPLLPHPSLSFL